MKPVLWNSLKTVSPINFFLSSHMWGAARCRNQSESQAWPECVYWCGWQAQAARAVLCGMRSLWPQYSAVHAQYRERPRQQWVRVHVLRHWGRQGPCHQYRLFQSDIRMYGERGNHGRSKVMKEWISGECLVSVSAKVWSLSNSAWSQDWEVKSGQKFAVSENCPESELDQPHHRPRDRSVEHHVFLQPPLHFISPGSGRQSRWASFTGVPVSPHVFGQNWIYL